MRTAALIILTFGTIILINRLEKGEEFIAIVGIGICLIWAVAILS